MVLIQEMFSAAAVRAVQAMGYPNMVVGPSRTQGKRMAGKAACKAALQRQLGLADAPDAPLFIAVSRLTEQKGLHLVLNGLDALLAQAGSDKTRILQAQVVLADIADFAGMNAEWDRWVVPGQGPARATIEGRLADPGWRIEIIVTAALT